VRKLWRFVIPFSITIALLTFSSCRSPESPGHKSFNKLPDPAPEEATPSTPTVEESTDDESDQRAATEARNIFKPDIKGDFTFEPAAQEINGWMVTAPEVVIRYSSSGKPVAIEFYAGALGTDMPPELVGIDTDPDDGWTVNWNVRDGFWAFWAEEKDQENHTKRSQPIPVRNAYFKPGSTPRPQSNQATEPNEVPQVQNSTVESISKELSQRKDVYIVTWSPDTTAVAFVQGDPQVLEGHAYLWKVGEQQPRTFDLARDRICEFVWSPNSQYIFIDIGTSSQREGIIVSTKELKTIGSIGYTHDPLWSPDSKWVALGVVRKVEPQIPWELGGTIDLALYNVASKELKVVAQGTSDFYYLPKKWESDGTLRYEKRSFQGESPHVPNLLGTSWSPVIVALILPGETGSGTGGRKRSLCVRGELQKPRCHPPATL